MRYNNFGEGIPNLDVFFEGKSAINFLEFCKNCVVKKAVDQKSAKYFEKHMDEIITNFKARYDESKKEHFVYKKGGREL